MFFTRNCSGRSLLLFFDDAFVSVYLRKFYNIFLAESSENLHSLGTEVMGPLTRRSKFTVTPQKVLADVELGAGGGELAGSMRTIAFVVMWANLEERKFSGG